MKSYMRNIFYFLLIIFLVSCNKESRTPETDTKKDDKSNKEAKPLEPQNAADEETKKDEIKNLTYEVTKAPAVIKYDGKIVASAKWEDKMGENIVLITETSEKTQSGDNRMKELFGYHYILNGGDAKLLWRINDFVKDCPVDITLSYMTNSFSITDLDKNGIAESSFLYKSSCKGDVSADDMKLIMHEGEIKFAIRGIMKLIVNGETYEKGTMNIDPSFDKAPKEFLDYAKSRWEKHQTEKIGN
jgi:hypothetical protein